MKSTTPLTLRFALVLAGLSALGRASNLSDVAATADAVVIGTVDTRYESRDVVSFDIRFLRVLKGTGLPNSVSVGHSWAGGAQGLPATFDGQITGIWFLSHSGRLRACSEACTFPRPRVHQGAYSYAAGAPFVILGALLTSPDTSYKAVGVAGMLSMNQGSALSVLTNVWPELADEPTRSVILSALRDEWRDTTPAGVAQLSALVNSSTVAADLRAAAIRSLMATHTAASLPLFSQLLFGSNPTERIEAAIAISAFVNGCNPQTPATVASLGHLQCDNQTAYKTAETMANRVFGAGSQAEQASAIAYWQSWWTSHPEVQ